MEKFYVPWYAGDEESNDWISYLHRNSQHVTGENTPFHDTSWLSDSQDANIHDEVLKALYESTDVDASNIRVYVVSGTVNLTGTVSSKEQIQAAARIVETIDSVWRIQNDLINDEGGARFHH